MAVVGSRWVGEYHSLDIGVYLLLIAGLISAMYLNISYATAAHKRARMEKELEISKLGALKTKAELEALQAKINPHFLYNTLNSIAELSVHQGMKARVKMTIALAELFRYSLNKQNETGNFGRTGDGNGAELPDD